MTIDDQMQSAVSAIRAQRLTDARAILEDVLDRHPDQANARWMLVQCLDSLGEREPLLRHVAKLLENDPRNVEAVNRMADFLHQRNFPLWPALDAYRAYLGQNPGDTTARFNLAYYLGKDGAFAEAVEAYEQALAGRVAAPEEAHVNIANLCMDHLHDNDRAREHLERAIELNPRYKGGWYNLGNLSERLGQRERAKE